MYKKAVIQFFAIIFLACYGTSAPIQIPQTRIGWLILDNWGSMYLFNNTGLWRVSSHLREQMKNQTGKAISVQVLKLRHAGLDMGLPVIEKIGAISEIKLPDEPKVSLELCFCGGSGKVSVPENEPVAFTISFKLSSTNEYQFSPGRLTAVILREATPEELNQNGWPSVVEQAGQSFDVLLARNTWDYYEQYAQIFPFRTYGGCFNAQGPFTYSTGMQRLFKPGKYQMWIGYPRYTGVPYPGFMSRTVSFQVQKKRPEAKPMR